MSFNIFFSWNRRFLHYFLLPKFLHYLLALLEGHAVLECYLSNIAEGVSVISSCDKLSHSWRTWEDALYLSVLVFQAQKIYKNKTKLLDQAWMKNYFRLHVTPLFHPSVHSLWKAKPHIWFHNPNNSCRTFVCQTK